MALRFPATRAFALLALLLLAVPAYSQTPPAAAHPAGSLRYDIAQEITLSGTVSSVLTKPSRGMLMGAHLLVETSSGTVDASLGRFAFAGKDALSISSGQRVEITGVMKTLTNQQVFLVRTIRVNEQVHVLRNEHGFPVTPLARQRAAGNPAQKGASL